MTPTPEHQHADDVLRTQMRTRHRGAAIAYLAIGAGIAIFQPVQPAQALAISNFVAAGVVFLISLVSYLRPPPMLVGVLFVSTVAASALVYPWLTGRPQLAVVLVIVIFLGAGVAASRAMAITLAALSFTGWIAISGQFEPAARVTWSSLLLASCVGGVLIAVTRARYERELIGHAAASERARQRLLAQTAELEAARDEAIESARAKGRFLANMSHEVRTPLNGITGMLSLLSQTRLRQDQREYLDEIVRSSDALLNVVNDILDVSKIEAGAVELEMVAFDLATALEDVASSHAATAVNKRVELIVDIDAKLPKQVIGDPLRLRQVVTNLVSNAIKFTDGGEVVLSATVLEQDEARVVVRISVTDSGVGIAEGQLANIFNPFSQADSSTTRRFGGTGLGLTISHQLVGLMGAQLAVDSVLGEGSTFWFDLDLEQEDLLTSRGLQLSARLFQAHVLVIDASPRVRATLGGQLGAWSVTVSEAGTLAEGRQMAVSAHDRGTPVDVIILDLATLGKPIGKRARAFARQVGPLGARLIGMGGPLRELAEQGDRAGFAELLPKPIHRSKLLAALNAALTAEARIPERSDSTLKQILRPSSGDIEPTAPNGLCVLVAEDNETNQRVVQGHLRLLGYDSDVVMDGEGAVWAVMRDQKSYACVLMDGQMPGLDGYQATQRIRALESQEGRERTPIIALTAHAMTGDREIAIEAGMDDYLMKPFTLEQLREVLERWCSARGSTVSSTRDSGPPSLPAEATDETSDRMTDQNDWRDVLDATIIEQLTQLEQASPGFLAQVTESYVRTGKENVDALLAAADRGDETTMKRRAHALLGSSRQVGARVLGQLCQEIEHGEGPSAVKSQLDQVAPEFERAKTALLKVVEQGA